MLEVYLTLSICATVFVCLLFKGAGRRDEIPSCFGSNPNYAGQTYNDCETCNQIDKCLTGERL